jgi:hypothetical protein
MHDWSHASAIKLGAAISYGRRSLGTNRIQNDDVEHTVPSRLVWESTFASSGDTGRSNRAGVNDLAVWFFDEARLSFDFAPGDPPEANS